MGNSIGTALSSNMNAAVQRIRDQANAAARATSPDAARFVDALDATANHETPPNIDSADDIYQRAKLLDSARNGQADAIMAALQQASDERWERHGRAQGGGFDLGDLF